MSAISTFLLLIVNVQIVFMLHSCEQQSTCHECIQNPTVCVWCAMNEFNDTRCKPRASYNESWCPTLLQNPAGSAQVSASDKRDFSSDPGNVIQIKPQRYKLKLRPGEPVNFNFSFNAASNYPVDLYFLLDGSRNMDGVKTQTAKQSTKIYHAMKEMTNDVHIAMGTFIDKNVLPIVKVIKSEKAYSFRHRLKLTPDIEQFKKLLSDTPYGGNEDVQEGGLDALAQVLVCDDIIGWRKDSRKIVVFLTNGPYHAAGDGKSAGIFQPYDGKCYTTNNTYTKEAEFDYPSPGIINKLALQRNIIVLFVVDNKQKSIYKDLSSVISGSKLSSFDMTLSETRDAIVNILKRIYEEISLTIKLKVIKRGVGSSMPVQIVFNPDCTKYENSDNCKVLKGQEQHFTGTINLQKYEGTDKMIIDIAIEGIDEKLTLDIDVLKDCDCEKPEQSLVSNKCFGELLQCGICKCGKERYGEKCACVVKNETNPYNDKSTCIAEGSDEECSGQGSCFCGTCDCREGYQGKYCQCNMNNCPKGIDNTICNDRGICDCLECTCEAGWTGTACECSQSDEGCRGTENKICNNRGECECSSCKCYDMAKWDARKSQDKLCNIDPCPDCHNLQCRILDKCALCHWQKDKCECDNEITTTTVDKLSDEYLNSSIWNLCPDVRVDVGCYTRYVYRYTEDNYGIEMFVQSDKNCVESYLLFGAMFFLALIFIGVTTLIAWKVLTNARDRNEYEKFLKQHKNDLSGPCNNPLYEPASTTFSNPAFRKRSISFSIR